MPTSNQNRLMFTREFCFDNFIFRVPHFFRILLIIIFMFNKLLKCYSTLGCPHLNRNHLYNNEESISFNPHFYS